MKQRAEIRQRSSLEESLEEGALARLSLAFIIAYMAFFTMKTVPGFFSTDVEHFEHAFTIVFSAEYFLRIAVYRERKKFCLSFFGIADFFSTVPALLIMVGVPSPLGSTLFLRAIRILRMFKLLRSKHMSTALTDIGTALSEIKSDLAVFGVGVMLMLYMSAVGIYYFENAAQPTQFSSIPESLWWAVSTFTTVGYGDIVPTTTGGKLFTSFMTLLGIGVVAIPTSLITAAITKQRAERKNRVQPLTPRREISTEAQSDSPENRMDD